MICAAKGRLCCLYVEIGLLSVMSVRNRQNRESLRGLFSPATGAVCAMVANLLPIYAPAFGRGNAGSGLGIDSFGDKVELGPPD